MWSDRKPWWQKKAKTNQGKRSPDAKTWCVIKVMNLVYDPNKWNGGVLTVYKAVGRMNAPKWFDPLTGESINSIEVDNLTKHEAHCVEIGRAHV